MQSGVLPHLAEVIFFVDIGEIAITLILGLLEAVQAIVHIAALGVDLGEHVRVLRSLFGSGDLGRYARPGVLL